MFVNYSIIQSLQRLSASEAAALVENEFHRLSGNQLAYLAHKLSRHPDTVCRLVTRIDEQCMWRTMTARDRCAALISLARSGRVIHLNGVDDISRMSNFRHREIAGIAWALSTLHAKYPIDAFIGMFMKTAESAKGVDFAQLSVAACADADLSTLPVFLKRLMESIDDGLDLTNVDIIVLASSLYTLSHRLYLFV